ncbi:hypothetical protein [Novosphingobium sp. AP12]|uniref:hypothetical protein n=1 Tax=Novosphingobium sp. AP12 TaxID=1144305 RepID=UPI0002721EE4|nr:hypothetical protein [Novosphingobium sp. AP12]EJL30093.1 RNA polymerase sigma factor, sigma-70 family [Novosphingobium sp. AP12]
MSKLSPQQIEQIVGRREELGHSYDQLAKAFGVSSGAVYYQCLKHGARGPRQRFLPVPSQQRTTHCKNGVTQRTFTEEEDRQMLALEMEGLSYLEISRRVGRAYTSVRMRIMRLAMAEEAAS